MTAIIATYFFLAGSAYEVVKGNLGRKPWRRARALGAGLLWPWLGVYDLWLTYHVEMWRRDKR